jgi:hypothetical protein
MRAGRASFARAGPKVRSKAGGARGRVARGGGVSVGRAPPPTLTPISFFKNLTCFHPLLASRAAGRARLLQHRLHHCRQQRHEPVRLRD